MLQDYFEIPPPPKIEAKSSFYTTPIKLEISRAYAQNDTGTYRFPPIRHNKEYARTNYNVSGSTFDHLHPDKHSAGKKNPNIFTWMGLHTEKIVKPEFPIFENPDTPFVGGGLPVATGTLATSHVTQPRNPSPPATRTTPPGPASPTRSESTSSFKTAVSNASVGETGGIEYILRSAFGNTVSLEGTSLGTEFNLEEAIERGEPQAQATSEARYITPSKSQSITLSSVRSESNSLERENETFNRLFNKVQVIANKGGDTIPVTASEEKLVTNMARRFRQAQQREKISRPELDTEALQNTNVKGKVEIIDDTLSRLATMNMNELYHFWKGKNMNYFVGTSITRDTTLQEYEELREKLERGEFIKRPRGSKK